MTLFESPPVDPRKERRRQMLARAAATLLVVLLVASPLLWFFRNWPEEHRVDKFFSAVERKDFKAAYALWQSDSDWEQHADRYSNYPFGQFQLDWGPTGEWGEIKSHDVKGSAAPRSKTGTVSGVIVCVQVNGRAEPAALWVEKSTKAISYSPYPCRY